MSDSDQHLPARRIEPAARERVAQSLAHSFAADHIGADELEARLARVYSAMTTAELAGIVADLPEIVEECGLGERNGRVRTGKHYRKNRKGWSQVTPPRR